MEYYYNMDGCIIFTKIQVKKLDTISNFEFPIDVLLCMCDEINRKGSIPGELTRNNSNTADFAFVDLKNVTHTVSNAKVIDGELYVDVKFIHEHIVQVIKELIIDRIVPILTIRAVGVTGNGVVNKENLTLVSIDCDGFRKKTLQELICPTVSYTEGRVVLTGTPMGDNYFKRLWYEKTDVPGTQTDD